MRKYDLAASGAGLGGLAAAALLARRNKRVVLIDPNRTVGGSLQAVRKDGFFFSTGPSLSLGFERGGALQELSSDLAISQSAAVLSPTYQVVLPDRRISVYEEAGETLEELKREFPRELDSLARFYREVRRMAERSTKNRFSAYLQKRRTAGPFIRSFRFSRELNLFLDLSARAFFQQDASNLSLAALVLLFDTAPRSLQGGLHHLSEQLLSSILRHGGAVKYDEPDAAILTDPGRVRGLRLSDGSVLESSAVLLNKPMPPGSTTLGIGVRDEVIPLGMSRDVICLPADSDNRLLFTLAVSAPDDQDAAPRGMRALTVNFPLLPPGAVPPGGLVPVLEGLIPFLERFMVTIQELGRVPERTSGSASGATRQFRDPLGRSLLGRSSIRGLYLIPDDPRTPLRTVTAARTLAERLA